MGTEAELALAAGFFGGMFVTAVVLWFHERRTRQVLEDGSGRLRRNEARTHALLRESRDVLALVDRDGTLRYVSPAADRILGRSSAQFSGTNFAALIHPEDLPRVVAALEVPTAPGGPDAAARVPRPAPRRPLGVPRSRHRGLAPRP